MKLRTLMMVLLVTIVVVVLGLSVISAQDATIVMYMQMGGDPGIASVAARTSGAQAAAAALGIELHEQYSSWDQQKMIEAFRQAIAAQPDCIEIMGHPGEEAMMPLVQEAVDAGIIVTSGNNPMPNIEAAFRDQGFGYAGADLYAGGHLTGEAMVAQGNLQPGDEALVYDIWHQELRSRSSQGVFDALTEAGLVVDQLDVSQEVDSEASLAIPILTAYMEAHPNLKAIGTQHGQITGILPTVLEQAGKQPGEIVVGGIDLGPEIVQAIKDGWITASIDQALYLQGYYPVLQCWLTKNFYYPGMDFDTGVGTVNTANVEQIAPLIEQGLR
ncbi:MAG: substrate-binding domain-containing protein [Anaerolineae bacterium]|nr:substrate-binding domain-containing protein [Anaerolineae bacterium]